MRYPLVRLIIAYFVVLERLWHRRNFILLIIGVFYMALVWLGLIFFEVYETAFTNLFVQWLDNTLAIDIREYATLSSFFFFLYIVSTRICLVLFLFFCIYFLSLLLLMPLHYICTKYVLNRIGGMYIPFSLKQIYQCYLNVYKFLFRQGGWDMFYLFVCLVGSFLPYIGFAFVILSLLIACHLLGNAHVRFIDAIVVGQNLSDYPTIHWTVGFMLVFSLFCPFVGWFLLPMWHSAALVHYTDIEWKEAV